MRQAFLISNGHLVGTPSRRPKAWASIQNQHSTADQEIRQRARRSNVCVFGTHIHAIVFEVYILQNKVCTATTLDGVGGVGLPPPSPPHSSRGRHRSSIAEGDTLEMYWQSLTALRVM